jgi:hypothetical protein
MTARDWVAVRGPRLALAAVGVAALLAAWALGRALDVDERPARAAATRLPEPPDLAARPPRVGVRAIVSRDPFAPDRTAPVERYLIAGPEELVAEEPAESEPALRPQLLGTVVSSRPGRSFAICRLGNAPPATVRVGERLGAYTVQAIERGRVTFVTAAGGRLVVDDAPPPSAR